MIATPRRHHGDLRAQAGSSPGTELGNCGTRPSCGTMLPLPAVFPEAHSGNSRSTASSGIMHHTREAIANPYDRARHFPPPASRRDAFREPCYRRPASPRSPAPPPGAARCSRSPRTRFHWRARDVREGPRASTVPKPATIPKASAIYRQRTSDSSPAPRFAEFPGIFVGHPNLSCPDPHDIIIQARDTLAYRIHTL